MARSPRLPSFPSDLPRAVLDAHDAAQAVAFWLGVLLPLAHVPLLLLANVRNGVGVDLAVGLVTLNAVACVAGHGHEPAGSR